MSNPRIQAQRIQERAEQAVAYWIERLADDGRSFVGSEDEQRFLPLSALLADLLERGVKPIATGMELDRAELVADQIEAYGMGSEGMRIRARGAYEDMMARREEESVPLVFFQDRYEQLMTCLHQIDVNHVEDLGSALLEARRLLIEMEELLIGDA